MISTENEKMFLYKRKKDHINVYSFEANKEALINYREKIIKEKSVNTDGFFDRFDTHELFYRLDTTDKSMSAKLSKHEDMHIDSIIYHNARNDFSDFRRLHKVVANQKLYDILIQEYIQGKYSHLVPTIIYNTIRSDDVHDYLCGILALSRIPLAVSHPRGIFGGEFYSYMFEKIMCLPKELCALQLLETGQFQQLIRYRLDINKQLRFFSTKCIDSVDISVLDKPQENSLLKYHDDLETFPSTVDTTEKILEKVFHRGKF